MGENASQIREEIDHTRDQLGDTLEALSYKTDIPARASEILVSGMGTAKDTVERAMEHVRNSIDDTAKNLQTQVQSTVTDVTANAQSVVDSAQSLVNSTSEQVRSSIKDLSERSEPLVHAGQEKLQKVKSASDEAVNKTLENGLTFIRENPLTATICGVMFGMVLARIMPRRQQS